MSRDLRSNIRNYSEPILIINRVQNVENGMVVNDHTLESEKAIKKAYAEVKNNYYVSQSQSNNARVVDADIKIRILNPRVEMIPEITDIVVRGKLYVVVKTDPYGLNTEDLWVYAKYKGPYNEL